MAIAQSSSELGPAWRAPLYWMSSGAFAIGTEGFMIAAILPQIAGDVGVTVGSAGLLVSAFTLTYAVTSPLLTTLTWRLDRRRLLTACMLVFAAGNVMAALAGSFLELLVARLVMAMAAGLFVPNANALAGALAPSEKRGQALAIVTGGLSAAVALGVPAGAFIGAHLGWRVTFVAVSILAVIAATGLAIGLPKDAGGTPKAMTLRERATPLRDASVTFGLLATFLWAAGTYSAYTYVSPLLLKTAGLGHDQVSPVLFLWGVSACIGLAIGGRAADRFGGGRVVAMSLPTLMLALLFFSVIAEWAAEPHLLIALSLVAVWGFSAWAFFPAQQSHLIGAGGVGNAPITLSLNASFQYAGFALGAFLGGVTVDQISVTGLGLTGALCVVLAILFDQVGKRAAVRPA